MHLLKPIMYAIFVAVLPHYGVALQTSASSEKVTLVSNPATVTIRSEDPSLAAVRLFFQNRKEAYLHESKDRLWSFQIRLDDGFAIDTIASTDPVFMTMQAPGRNSYTLFISPGDRLEIAIPASSDDQIVVNGKGSEHNQLLVTAGWVNTDAYEADTLPDRILADFRKMYQADSMAFANYVQRYRPGKTFIDAQRYNLQYFVLNAFYHFVGNHKYMLRSHPDGERLLSLWDQAVERLIDAADINNDAALIAPNYTDFISEFLLRKKEALWGLHQTDVSKLAADWYEGNEAEAKNLFMDDPENLLTEKIIKRYFSGETAAFAYAHLIGSALGSKEDNLSQIFENFKVAYPSSPYLPVFEPAIETIRDKSSRMLTEGAVFADEHGTFTTLEQVLDLVKGKAALLDMWGTWCGPCREEIDLHSQALKEHFKDTNVAFVYVANYDLNTQQKWKDLIAYYGLEGTHILASQQLTEDIMKKTGGEGFPTYVVVHPNGTYELSKAGYPLKRDELIRQLEGAAAK